MSEEKREKSGGVTRRDFMRTAAGAAAGIAISRAASARPGGHALGKSDINVAMIGTGSQGMILMQATLDIPGVHYKAICDIWKYSQRYGSGTCKKFGMPVKVYTDYREMLAAEKDLDAVIIATPDWVHAEQAIACLEAGKHVYCEKEMSNTLEGCRSMVRAAERTGRLLQIGHQRRSNPRYLHAAKFVFNDKVLGRITHCNAQWNRSGRLHRKIPKAYVISDADLRRYGYDSMERFRNWRWYRKFSGGPMADLGSHQVDIFNWFLDTTPKSVIASGGVDYYEENEWYDNVMAIYDYDTPQGAARGFYQVLNTTSFGGYQEVFMGDKGSLQISENTKIGFFFPEIAKKAAEWIDHTEGIEGMDKKALALNIGASRKEDGSKAANTLKAEADALKPPHQPHLENFFRAIRDGTKLTCPADEAFMTAVPILRTNDAVATGKRIVLTAADYEV